MKKFIIPKEAKSAEQYIAALQAKKQNLTDEEYVEGVEEIASQMEKDILSAKTEISFSGTAYYVSNKGSDENDGKSPQGAWATIEKVKSFDFLPGDAVLFERGGFFRGNKITAKNGVTYSSYGEGEKPVICGSEKNYADASLWVKTAYRNVYECIDELDNVGIIAFDHSGIMSKYDEVVGTMRISGAKDGFTGEKDLSGDLQFFSNLETKKLYLYCENGNPGKRFKSIEIGHFGNIFGICGDNITIDNLLITLCGSHGVGSGTRTGLTVQNCVFRWLGGSVLKGFAGGNLVRYGNAVESYGGCKKYTVTNNYIYQIYDTAITHQFSAGSKVDCNMDGVTYIGNLVKFCHWSIEYYNQPVEGLSRTVKNVYITANLLQYGGYGWGSVPRMSGAALFNSFTLPEETENFVSEKNIFDRSTGPLVRLNEGGDRKVELYNNIYIQEKGKLLGLLFNKYYDFDYDAKKTILEQYKEENPTIVYSSKKPF